MASGIEAICEAGRLLNEAKADLPHGQFEKMVESDLPFGARAARMLAAIGRDNRIRNHGSEMPASWRTLYELTRLSDEQFAEGLKSGAINPEVLRQDAKALGCSGLELADKRAAAIIQQRNAAIEDLLIQDSFEGLSCALSQMEAHCAAADAAFEQFGRSIDRAKTEDLPFVRRLANGHGCDALAAYSDGSMSRLTEWCDSVVPRLEKRIAGLKGRQ